MSHPSRSRIKICHLIHLDGAGGGPVSVVDQIRAFNQEYDLSVLHGGTGIISTTCDALSIPHWKASIDKLWKLPWGFFQILFRLFIVNPDILVLHGQWGAPLGAIASRLVGIKATVYICHWPSFYTDWSLLRLLRNFFAEKIPCTLSSFVVVLSESSRYQYLLRKLVPVERLRVIPHFIDSSRISPSNHRVRLQFGWNKDEVHIVSVGRLTDQKRVDWLLHSWKLVSHKAGEARLWIIGDGKERMKLEQLAKTLGIADSCRFLGTQPNGIDFLAASDIVAITSMYESFGITALEAMSCGKPIVASAVDGLIDLIKEESGFLVPPGNIELFANRILELIKQPAIRAQMGKAGTTHAALYRHESNISAFRDMIAPLERKK